MKQSRFTDAQIMAFLKQVEAGQPLANATEQNQLIT